MAKQAASVKRATTLALGFTPLVGRGVVNVEWAGAGIAARERAALDAMYAEREEESRYQMHRFHEKNRCGCGDVTYAAFDCAQYDEMVENDDGSLAFAEETRRKENALLDAYYAEQRASLGIKVYA